MSSILKRMGKRINREVDRYPDPHLPTLIWVHGAMWYQCQTCGRKWRMWLEDGLEDRRDPEHHKPVPFCIGCTCGGMANHVNWNEDIRWDESRPLGDHMNYFKNDPKSDCGKPMLVGRDI